MTPNLSRRTFLAGVSAASLLATSELHAQQAAPTTPDAALQRLVEGNRRFAANQLTSFADDLKMLRDHTVDKQEPFAAVLSCADSRVPVELVFDQTIGHVFVVRVAGNLINAEIVGSLEYGAAVLGVKVLLVMGHAGCGAVTAAMAKKAVPGQIASLYPHLEAAVRRRRECRGHHQAKRSDPGEPAGEDLDGAGADGRGRQAEDPACVFRACDRHGDIAVELQEARRRFAGHAAGNGAGAGEVLQIMCSANAKSVKYLAAIALIGDGVMAIVQPSYYARVWKKGPKAWRVSMEWLAERPAVTRAIGAAEIVGGVLWMTA